MLRVVDIASHQYPIDPAALDCDAVIIKATGGTRYTNGYPNEDHDNWREWAETTLANGKLLAFYHYAMEYGEYNTPAAEARHFLDTIADYVGRAELILDFEADAQGLPVSWPHEWLDIVAAETGCSPMFYAYASYLNSRDHSEIAHYPLWMASYLDRYDGAGWVDDPDNRWPTNAWDHMTMYQYTSTGYIWGYDSRLDLSVFYGDTADWNALIGGGGAVDTRRIDRFCDAMRWAADSDQVGYSQSDRESLTAADFFGDGLYNTDCSKLVIEAAKYAGYDVDGATYTGNMTPAFLRAGYTIVPNDGNPLRGDVLLNEGNHTAGWLGDCLSQASIDENGDIAGGERGDQTGGEVNTGSYYDYPWDFYLRPPVDKSTLGDDDPMQFIYQPDEKPYLVYHDGTKNIGLNNPDQVVALQDNFRRCHGKELPIYALGTKESPWGARFEQVFPYMEASDVWGGHAK